MKIKLDLSNYAIKSDLKTQQALIHQILLKRSDLTSLKSDYDELNIDKLRNQQSGSDSFKSKADKIEIDSLKPVPNDLSKLIDSVKNAVVEKGMDGEQVKTADVIDTSRKKILVKKNRLTSMKIKVK